jgi:hypothetical protein
MSQCLITRGTSSLVTGLRDGLSSPATRNWPLSFWDGFALGRRSSFVPQPRSLYSALLGSAARHHAVWTSALPSATRDVAPIDRPVASPRHSCGIGASAAGRAGCEHLARHGSEVPVEDCGLDCQRSSPKALGVVSESTIRPEPPDTTSAHRKAQTARQGVHPRRLAERAPGAIASESHIFHRYLRGLWRGL